MVVVVDAGLFASGALAGSLLLMLYRRYMDSNSEILTPSAMKKLGLPSDKREFSHIFAISNEGKRIDKATALLEVINERAKESDSALTKEQDVMTDLRRDLNRVQDKVRGSETQGEQEMVIHAELTPVLKRMGRSLDVIAAELNSIEVLACQTRFLGQVKQGFVRKQVHQNLVKRDALIAEKDTKMKEALKSASQTLKLGESLYQEAFEKWVEPI
jgi:small-conductance mechanosensitive channel